MKKVSLISIIVLFLFSCENHFSGYKDLGDETYMKLLSFEESEKSYANTDYVKAEIYVNDDVALLYHNFSDNILSKNNPFHFLLEHLKEGDSASFYVSKEKFEEEMEELTFPTIKNKYLTITIKVHQFYSLKEYETIKVDEEMLEQVLLNKYLLRHNISSKNKKNGLYFVSKKEGEGEGVKKGDKVIINYKAHFVNQIEFDNTYNDISFTFTYGNPDQVIRGLEIAIKGMKLGEEAKIIIPSQLAFGDEGSSTGVVPPFTTVIYTLKIVKIE